LSRVAVRTLEKWIAASGKKRTDYLSSGRGGDRPMSTRQLSHLVKLWITEAGLNPKRYTTESLRRTKALHILRGTGDLQAVHALLGHVQIESTARYLGLKTKADPIEVSRAFDIRPRHRIGAAAAATTRQPLEARRNWKPGLCGGTGQRVSPGRVPRLSGADGSLPDDQRIGRSGRLHQSRHARARRLAPCASRTREGSR
jgi:hypothetical protein